MHNLILAILCSVAVSVLLKIARKKNIIIEQAIAFNYITAITFSYFLLKPDFKGLEFTDYIVKSENSPIFLALGLLLPSVCWNCTFRCSTTSFVVSSYFIGVFNFS